MYTVSRCHFSSMLSLATALTCTTELDALIDIYDANGGNDWTGASHWNTNITYCDWEGVTCSRENYVVELNLSGFGLTGQLSSSIGCFPFLKSLYLNDNKLTSTIPEAICDLANLQYLQMDRAGLTGTIPTCMCSMTHLMYLYMDSNSLTGEIPTCVSNLTFLKEMHLKCNAISGTIPTGFNNLQFLTEVRFNCNDNLSCTSDLANKSDFIFLCGTTDCENCAIVQARCPVDITFANCGMYRSLRSS